VAQRLMKRMPGARAVLAATEKDLASRHIAACPLEIVQVSSPKLPGSMTSVPEFGVRMAAALTRSYGFLRELDPDLVLGLGGYGSVAPVMAARARRIPALLLEGNAVPGKATKFLSRLGAVVAASFDGMKEKGVRGRVVVTGNPLRERVLRTRKAHAEFGLDPSLPVLGVLGGSLGAKGLNERVARGVPALAAAVGAPFQVLHATGSDDDAAALRDAYAAAGVRARVEPFFVEMEAVYGTLDACVCRGGGATVAEVAALGIPAVVVPYPHHKDEQQRHNAEPLVAGGAAALVLERDLSPEALASAVAPLVRDPALRAARAASMRRMGRPDAADRVVDLVLELTKYTADEAPAASGLLEVGQ
jgi:UDP-N-acetylglucosamine--N-acetylmuramyl-(pentapeptide) pyrophosphoryl-undecaprenol N-acetylglucosamine transferase